MLKLKLSHSLRHQLTLTQTPTSYTSKYASLVTLHPTEKHERRLKAGSCLYPTESVVNE